MQVTFSRCPQQLTHSQIMMPSRLESKVVEENNKNKLEVPRNHNKNWSHASNMKSRTWNEDNNREKLNSWTLYITLTPYRAKACSLSVLYGYGRRRHKLYLAISFPAATNSFTSLKVWYQLNRLQQENSNLKNQEIWTFGCLMPRMRPHCDRSCDISAPTSS